jgi:hypothetical protein
MSEKQSQQEKLIDFSELGIQLDEPFEDDQEDLIEMSSSLKVADDEGRFMVLSKPPRERRNWKRFSIDGAFVMAMKPPRLSFLKPVYFKLGPVKDIGMKGLAIHYVEKSTDGSKFKNAPYLSIVLPDGTVIVDKISFKIVNTVKVADLPGDKEIWNLCVKFKKLLPLQRVLIEQFIDQYGNELKSKWPKGETGSEQG